MTIWCIILNPNIALILQVHKKRNKYVVKKYFWSMLFWVSKKKFRHLHKMALS